MTSSAGLVGLFSPISIPPQKAGYLLDTPAHLNRQDKSFYVFFGLSKAWDKAPSLVISKSPSVSRSSRPTVKRSLLCIHGYIVKNRRMQGIPGGADTACRFVEGIIDKKSHIPLSFPDIRPDLQFHRSVIYRH